MPMVYERAKARRKLAASLRAINRGTSPIQASRDTLCLGNAKTNKAAEANDRRKSLGGGFNFLIDGASAIAPGFDLASIPRGGTTIRTVGHGRCLEFPT